MFGLKTFILIGTLTKLYKAGKREIERENQDEQRTNIGGNICYGVPYVCLFIYLLYIYIYYLYCFDILGGKRAIAQS